jgi:hypothetical protein
VIGLEGPDPHLAHDEFAEVVGIGHVDGSAGEGVQCAEYPSSCFVFERDIEDVLPQS